LNKILYILNMSMSMSGWRTISSKSGEMCSCNEAFCSWHK